MGNGHDPIMEIQIVNSGGPVLPNAAVHLLFWGPSWNMVAVQPVQNAIQTLLASPYMSELAQYGVGPASLDGMPFVTNTNPPNPFSMEDVANFVRDAINSGSIAPPDAGRGGDLYCVMLEPGIEFQPPAPLPEPPFGAHGSVSINDLLSLSSEKVAYAWVRNPADVDVVSTTIRFSHELAEACVDPDPVDNPAWRVAGGPFDRMEICDVCSSFGSVNGVTVVGYYSQRDHLCLVPGFGPQWSDEWDLGGNLASAPAVAAWSFHWEVFYAGENRELKRRFWDGNWSDELGMGGILSSAPAAVSWLPHRIDVFYRGQNQHLWHRSSTDGNWEGEEDRGGILTSSPAVSSWGYRRLDVFYRGLNQHLWHRPFDGNWGNEDDRGGVLTSSPGAASWGPNRVDVFYRGQNGHLWHRAFDGHWNDEEDLGGILTSSPSVASWGENRLDIFYRGQDLHLMQKTWNGLWQDEADLGGVLASAPAAVSSPAVGVRLDVFYRGLNGHLRQRTFA